jgi:hypothetical protein
MCLNIASLDHYAAAFHDFPCRATAERYEAQAIAFAASCVIRIDELENILSILWPFLEIKQGPLA